jgi:GNAT superfamily N-acetyltransferase
MRRIPIKVRAMRESDLPDVGDCLRVAFGEVYRQRAFSTPFPTLDGAVWLASSYLALDAYGAFVAESEGRPCGAAFVHLRGGAASVGPVAALPSAPRGVGRALMAQLLEVAGERSIRLFQDAFNPESFALYTKLGFRSLEPVAYVVADVLAGGRKAAECSPLRESDLDEVFALDEALSGNRRQADLHEVLLFGSGLVLRRDGRLVGYLLARRGTNRLVIAPACAERSQDLQLLLSDFAYRNAGHGATARIPAGTRLGGDGAVLAAGVELGFRIEHLGHLMVRGPYPAAPGAQLLAIFPESL